MRATYQYHDYKDSYEYHGSTTIERIRKRGNIMVRRDWLIFDSVEEALTYYNDNCID